MDEEQGFEIVGIIEYDRPAPRRYQYAFLNVEARDMEGRLKMAAYMHKGQQWWIGPGGDEW